MTWLGKVSKAKSVHTYFIVLYVYVYIYVYIRLNVLYKRLASIRNKMLVQADLWSVPVQLCWWNRRDERAVGSDQFQSESCLPHWVVEA